MPHFLLIYIYIYIITREYTQELVEYYAKSVCTCCELYDNPTGTSNKYK